MLSLFSDDSYVNWTTYRRGMIEVSSVLRRLSPNSRRNTNRIILNTWQFPYDKLQLQYERICTRSFCHRCRNIYEAFRDYKPNITLVACLEASCRNNDKYKEQTGYVREPVSRPIRCIEACI